MSTMTFLHEQCSSWQVYELIISPDIHTLEEFSVERGVWALPVTA
jgi:hypothetical protein